MSLPAGSDWHAPDVQGGPLLSWCLCLAGCSKSSGRIGIGLPAWGTIRVVEVQELTATLDQAIELHGLRASSTITAGAGSLLSSRRIASCSSSSPATRRSPSSTARISPTADRDGCEQPAPGCRHRCSGRPSARTGSWPPDRRGRIGPARRGRGGSVAARDGYAVGGRELFRTDDRLVVAGVPLPVQGVHAETAAPGICCST